MDFMARCLGVWVDGFFPSKRTWVVRGLLFCVGGVCSLSFAKGFVFSPSVQRFGTLDDILGVQVVNFFCLSSTAVFVVFNMCVDDDFNSVKSFMRS